MKTALVTGANRGIGLEIARGLAAKGLHVLLACRDLKMAEQVAADFTGKHSVVELDLSSRNILRTHLARILESYPQIDVLVNNAGVLPQGSFLETSEDDFELALQVNFRAPYELMRALAPGMTERNYGRIVNVSSGWGSFGEGLDGPTSYSVSKAALNALTVSFSHSAAPCIKVNSMCPGWVRTRMGGDNAERSPQEGAETALWLATLPDEGPSGGFFRDKSEIPW